MGLLDLLKKGYSTLGVGQLPGDKNKFNSVAGTRPSDRYNDIPGVNSKLHYTYSITGIPSVNGVKTTPSKLDLDGEIPADRYTVTAPEGRGGSIK